MHNTREALKTLARLGGTLAWGAGHVLFWVWLVPDSLWALAGAITTGIILPMLVTAIYSDLRGSADHG